MGGGVWKGKWRVVVTVKGEVLGVGQERRKRVAGRGRALPHHGAAQHVALARAVDRHLQHMGQRE